MPRHVPIEPEGTHVDLDSQNLPVEELVEIAALLVRASGSLPPLVER